LRRDLLSAPNQSAPLSEYMANHSPQSTINMPIRIVA
jgi:hypothetical protein